LNGRAAGCTRYIPPHGSRDHCFGESSSLNTENTAPPALSQVWTRGVFQASSPRLIVCLYTGSSIFPNTG